MERRAPVSPNGGPQPRIFVQIPSYRDPDCQWTIKDLFENAARPERIFVGVLWQFVPELDQDCFVVRTRPEQVRTKEVHALESGGYSWACAEVERLWRGEEYTMRIDSHMRFEPAWDETLIRLLAQCPSPKSVLTCYPEGFTPPRNIQGRGVVSKPVAKEFGANRVLVFGSIVNPEPDLPPEPMMTAFLAGGFYFAPSSTLREVPWDPHLYFFGTEASMAARLWTHGYDLYSPNCSILYHNYERTGRKLHWEDHRKWALVKERSDARVRHLFRTETSADEDVTREMRTYGFGQIRSLDDYEAFTGISFKDCTISERAKSYFFPYEEPGGERLRDSSSADLQQRRPEHSRGTHEAEPRPPGEAPARHTARRYTLTSSFNGPGVPQYLWAKNQGLAGRREIERQLQVIASELIFGADPNSLMTRLVELGAPLTEARRIIETAERDPLIVNGRDMALMIRRRDWLLDSLNKLQRLSSRAKSIERKSEISGSEFLEFHYARNLPVVMPRELAGSPALSKWTPSFLGEAASLLPHRGGVVASHDGSTVDISMDSDAFAPLASDLRPLEKFLDRTHPWREGVVRIAQEHAFVALHGAPRNQLLAQIAGRTRLKLIAAADVANVYDRFGLVSEVGDLDADGAVPARFPLLANAHIHEITLDSGEMIFIPLAWWCQWRAVEAGVTASFVNFRWPNDMHRAFPQHPGARRAP